MKRLVVLLVVGSFFLLHQQTVSAQELIVNGGFEADTGSPPSGWTYWGNTGFLSTVNNPAGAHSGNNYFNAGPVGSVGGIQQTIATTVGQTYTLSFWEQSDGNLPNEFVVIWGGVTVADVISDPAHPYTNTVLSLTATTGSTNLQFGFRNDPGFLQFDDASLVANAVPEPATWALMGLSSSAIGAGLYWNRKRRSRRRTRTGQVPAKA